jgi:aminopeptidase C
MFTVGILLKIAKVIELLTESWNDGYQRPFQSLEPWDPKDMGRVFIPSSLPQGKD